MVRSAEVDEYKQKIEEDIGEELKVSPKHIRNYRTSNIFHRAFSYLFGWTRRGVPVKLRATETGTLKVASSGAGLEWTETIPGEAGADYAAEKVFSEPVNRVLIIVKDNDMYFKPSPDGIEYAGQVLCFGANSLELDLVVTSFKVKRAGTNNANYEVVGMR